MAEIAVSKERVRNLTEQGNRLFQERQPLMSLWQSLAEQFDPIRADFTTNLDTSGEFASHLMSGRPLLAQRDLGNAIASMLRPRGQQWVHARTTNERTNKEASSKQVLDSISERILTIFNYQHSQFQRATKQGDKDFALFGQCIIEPNISRDRSYIFYNAWHLRDTVWCEDAELRIKRVDRNWNLEACEVSRLFPGKLDEAKLQLKDNPYRKLRCRHIVLPADDYDLSAYNGGKKVNKTRFPFVSIYISMDDDTILEEIPRRRLRYIIPRWVTPSGTQYAHSPATIVALPEARLLQQITLTLLEAGQKAVDPPLVATREAIMGAINYWPGATTWVDAEYDERLGAALRPVADFGSIDLRAGEMRAEKIEQLIHQAFFLDKITLPTMDGKQRTMYEVSKMFEDYVRGAAPLFEPLEVEYSAGLCEETFELGSDHGAFADIIGANGELLPRTLKGADVVWQFDSPLQSANERGKSEAFMASMNLLKIAAEADPDCKYDLDISKAHRDAQLGSGAPSDWIRPADEAERLKEEEREMAAQAAQAQAVAGLAGVASQVGTAAQSLQGAGMIPGGQQQQAA